MALVTDLKLLFLWGERGDEFLPPADVRYSRGTLRACIPRDVRGTNEDARGWTCSVVNDLAVDTRSMPRKQNKLDAKRQMREACTSNERNAATR